jgi:hypothetical protein
VIAGFMAQTGDGARGDGTGKSKYPDLPAEFTKLKAIERWADPIVKRGD